MYPNVQTSFPHNESYQQSQSHQTPRSFQQQQFGPRFQTPQQFTPPRSFYQPSHDHSRMSYPGPIQTQPLYQSAQNYETPPNPQYSQSPVNIGFNQPSIPTYRTPHPIQNYNQHPPIQNYNQPPQIQNYNQPPPIQNYNQPPPNQNYNQPPLIQSYNQPPPIQNYTPPFQSVNQNCHQPVSSPYQCPNQGYSTSNTPYQPQVQSPELLKQPYVQQQCPFNSPRQAFNQRLPFRPPGQQIFPFINQNPRFQQSQHSNNRFQFQPRQKQNYHPRASSNFSNQSNDNNIHSKDKLQIACQLGDCDFIGPPNAIKEHQNLHHKLGLHKKVLYSNNSDAVKNWIEERKKKWPTKDNIKTKVEIEDEKLKRGERIVNEDFQRFNNKNNKFNGNGSKRFNNRKRPNFNEFKEPIEEPMNGNLKRFAGIVDIEKEKYIDTNKPDALKLLEEYDESSENHSDNEPPEEIVIVKETALINNKSVTESINVTSPISKEIFLLENNVDENSILLVNNNSKTINTEIENKICSKVNEECKKPDLDHGQKRKKNSNKESKPFKKNQSLRTPRTEVMERKGALLEALMGDLMRSERNAITQCICYIRNNMHRFYKMQAA